MTTVNAFTGAPLPFDQNARAVYFNQVAITVWREACTSGKIHTSTSLLEAATQRAFPVEYDAAAAVPSHSASPSTIVEEALEKAFLGQFPSWSTSQDYNGQVDIPLLQGVQNLLDNGLGFNSIRTNLLEHLEFLKIGYVGEELVVEIWPFPLYGYQDEEISSRRRRAAMQRASDYVVGIDRIILERDTTRLSRDWPHVIQELREDAITLRVTGPFVEEKASEFNRQAKLRRIAKERLEQQVWAAGGRAQKTVLPSIESVLETPKEVWEKYQAEHPTCEVSGCGSGVCPKEFRSGQGKMCPMSRARMFGECASAARKPARSVAREGDASSSSKISEW